MEGFYVSIIFIGIMLIVFSLVLIAYDKKKSIDNAKVLEDKKQDLINIINDAEQMVEELNRFSDYIVNQMDIKNEELCATLKGIEEKAKKINQRIDEKPEMKSATQRNDMTVSCNNVEATGNDSEKLFGLNSDLIIDNIVFDNRGVIGDIYKPYNKVKEKVIPINNRYKEVIQLSERGLDNTEIAKRLNMGKGEIELTLGLNRN
jgi:hypothetical protein